MTSSARLTPLTDSADIDIAEIRAQFPALAGPTIYLENAGGSQVPRVVADAVRDYLLNTYAQLGAGYEISRQSTQTVDRAHKLMNRFMNGEGAGKVIMGPSTTSLCRMLAACYAQILKPGDEIILAETAHEANFGPWERMAEAHKLRVRSWKIDPGALECPIEGLNALITDRTKIVAFPHVSNLLGDIVDIEAITNHAHEAGARVVVDGVAYAPHRAIDVEKWNVDWYVFSNYKVYGPHVATMFGRSDAIDELTGPNHFFIPKGDVPYKFEPGGVAHESCAGVLALGRYLVWLAGRGTGASTDALDRGEFPTRDVIESALDVMEILEQPLQTRFVEYLQSKDQVRIIGPNHARPTRVPTISFVHEALDSREIVSAVDRNSSIGIRFGHMYAYRMCKALGLDIDAGVVRVSAVHYNTVDELNQLISILDRML